MSSSTKGALTNKRIRYVRDANCRIIEIREFDFKATVGNYCHSTVIKRNSTTQAIIGFFTKKSFVTQDDLNATSE